MRKSTGPFYVCGLRGWQTSAGIHGCYQRVRYIGQSVHNPTELEVPENGLLVTFSQPVEQKVAGNWDNWSIEQWNYRWTGRYGLTSKSLIQKMGHDESDVDDVYVSEDGKTVFWEVADLQPVMQMKIQYNIAADQGEKLNNAIYNTLYVLRPEIDPATVGKLSIRSTTHDDRRSELSKLWVVRSLGATRFSA